MLFKHQNHTLFQQLDPRPPTNSTKVMNNWGSKTTEEDYMTELIVQNIWFLVLAFALGLAVGWFSYQRQVDV